MARWAERREEVHALVLVGSQARTDVPADEWSDYDFVLVVDEDLPFLRGSAWLGELGTPLLSVVEAAAAGGLHERRVLFADGRAADFTLVPLARLEGVLARPDVADVVARGARVLVNDGALGDLPTEADAPLEDYPALVHEFWFHANLSARKLRRGELHVAVQSCNCALRSILRRALELEARASGREHWHQGRFFEQWADPGWRARMARTIATEDARQAAQAISLAAELFSEVCAVLQNRHGFEVSIDLPAVRSQLGVTLESLI